MGWSGLATVRSLTLSGNNLSREGLRALLRSPHAVGLKHLALRDTQLDGQAMAEFEAARKGLRLESLDIGENVLKAVGAEYLAVVPCLRELKSLRLDRCEITQAGARLFAKKATVLDGLRIPDVSHNHFGPSGLETLLEREPAELHTLRMRDNDLYFQGAELLAGSPASGPLVELDLSQNHPGAEACQALGRSEHLRSLLVLRVEDNSIPEAAAQSLANSPLGKRLLELDAGVSG
jgi:Ran GTPase-activating protein (RanGAP) involved in mRNA processing and transport